MVLAQFLKFLEFRKRLALELLEHLGLVILTDATLITGFFESQSVGEKFLIGEEFLFLEKEFAHVL